MHNNDSKVDFPNYGQKSRLPKNLRKVMYNRIYELFSDNNLIYSFQFGFRQRKIKLNRKTLCPSKSVKFLAIETDEKSNWKHS